MPSAAGRIGAIVSIDQRELMWREVTGWRAEQVHHALSVMGVHWFDGFRYLLGREADWIVATTHKSPAIDAAGETDASIHVRFGDVGVNYTESFSSRVERDRDDRDRRARAPCCSTTTSSRSTPLTEWRRSSNPWAGDGKPESAYLGLAELLRAIDEGDEPSNSGSDNLRTLSLLDGAYRSAATGELVRFENGVL